MARKKIFMLHRDSGHNIMYEDVPLEYTNGIGMPGEFEDKINRSVHLNDGTSGTMDAAYRTKPDGKTLFRPVATCLEHQFKPVTPQKAEKIGDYEIQMVAETHLPSLVAVATHTDKEKSVQELVRSPSNSIKFYFPDLSEENIWQRLNTVTEIINNNKVLSREEAINLGIIVLYAPPERGPEITEKVAKLYSKISHTLDSDMEYVLHSVISIMIDAYFDDEEEYQRLINMMNGVTSTQSKEKYDSYIRLEETISERDRKIEDLEKEVQFLKNKLNGK